MSCQSAPGPCINVLLIALSAEFKKSSSSHPSAAHFHRSLCVL
ncbi:unnamed protein product [Staurois parvus]|uniref:Uncharacterized protein n=1 Tax=Staurois parvus TaxID=386267 RepID=A0ABN9A6B8_9NEOB|nr:unnamed protein product [Staurois parvus]